MQGCALPKLLCPAVDEVQVRNACRLQDSKRAKLCPWRAMVARGCLQLIMLCLCEDSAVSTLHKHLNGCKHWVDFAWVPQVRLEALAWVGVRARSQKAWVCCQQ